MDSRIRTTGQLRELGVNKKLLTQLVSEGRLTRIARGWYAQSNAHPLATRAVALGGRLGCLSGCEFHGVWVPRDQQLHVVYGRGLQLPPRPGVTTHALDGPQPKSAVCPLLDCLSHVIHRHDAETALICLESATNRQLILPSHARELIISANPSISAQLSYFNPAAESGSETRVRLALQRRRVRVRPQVLIPGLGRVDMIAGDSLIIECDSDEHHSAVDPDRRRDKAARELGFKVVRLSYQQVWHTWDETLSHLVRIIQTRTHRLPRYPLPFPSSTYRSVTDSHSH